MATITVGQGQQYPTISAAVAAATDGDVVRVLAGIYTNDFSIVSKRLTFEGMGGMVHLTATVSPPNGKAIMTTTTDVTIYNFEFSGAAVADGNGAGIRYEGGNLVLDHTYFHGNQEGLLGADSPTGSITILNSEFANNGTGDGRTHNLYVGQINTMTIRDSYLHDTAAGHEIKSRALNTIVENNRVTSGPSGSGSYLIDLPNGGNAIIRNNVLEKGPNASNPVFISFGEEGGLYANPSLTVSNNTAVNDYNAHIPLFARAAIAATVSLTNNRFYNLTSARIHSGITPDIESGNSFITSRPTLDTSSPYQPPIAFALACFAEGTRIRAERGEIAVEDLRAGDRIVTVRDGAPTLTPVRWIGHRLVRPERHPRPETARPVRVMRDAFDTGAPCRDLLLSPDHAVHVDGVLIAIRQLINGTTICQEAACEAIRYFHVECDTHTVLLAEGLAAETYLDSGNRHAFANASAAVALYPDFAAARDTSARSVWSAHASAPFVTGEAAVLPVWRRLVRRAVILGHAVLGHAPVTPAVTGDAAPRLRAGDRWIAPVKMEKGHLAFVLPAGLTSARLVTRAARPTDTRPWLEDRRVLGVAVSRLVLRMGATIRDIPLDHPSLSRGWWAVERDGSRLSRWTTGDALIPLPHLDTPATLELSLEGDMLYPMDTHSARPCAGDGNRIMKETRQLSDSGLAA